jgi:large subunit ribosomal protein L25
VAETFTLEAQPRAVTGRKVGQLRRAGLVPAIIYGSRLAAPISVQIPYRALQVTLMKAGGTHLIDVTVDGSEHVVLAREVQRDIIRGDIMHVDFLAVAMDQTITTEVPVHLTGESPAVEGRLGTLAQVQSTVTIEALPRDLISVVEVDVTGLNAIGDSVHVRDVNLGDKVRILNDQDMLLVHVVPVALAVTDEELDAETGAAEPELIRPEREDEEEE